MERYAIWEGFMGELEKKVARIRRKCEKFGCDFRFEKVGEEIREVPDYNNINPITKKPEVVNCKFIICEAEGVAQVNGWQFVASVEHTSKGNIYSKAMTDVEIPERYRNSTPYCEHCHSNRHRKGTFIVINTETREFKQVGQNCLADFTHGMSASCAAYMASLRTIFAEEEEKPVSFGGGGFRMRYYDTQEFLRYTAETIRHFGFSKSNDGTSTRSRVSEFFDVSHGRTHYWKRKEIDRVRDLMEHVGFDPDSEEANKMVKEALEWLDGQEAENDYLHNLKVVTALDFVDDYRFGLLVSLFPTWNRDLERQAKLRAEQEAGKKSEHVGKIGDRIVVEVEKIKCITSWDSNFNGHDVTTYVWKIVGKDNNIYTWKTSHWFDEDRPPVSIKGTVKDHNEYREVKQTELTRCKIEKPWQKPKKEAATQEQTYEGSGQEGFDLFWNSVNA